MFQGISQKSVKSQGSLLYSYEFCLGKFCSFMSSGWSKDPQNIYGNVLALELHRRRVLAFLKILFQSSLLLALAVHIRTPSILSHIILPSGSRSSMQSVSTWIRLKGSFCRSFILHPYQMPSPLQTTNITYKKYLVKSLRVLSYDIIHTQNKQNMPISLWD